jgi:hypothetical protein
MLGTGGSLAARRFFPDLGFGPRTDVGHSFFKNHFAELVVLGVSLLVLSGAERLSHGGEF